MKQRKTYDIFVREGDTLKWVQSYHQLGRVRDYIHTHTAQGSELYARRLVVGKVEWYCYSAISISGLGYAHSDIYQLQVTQQ